MHCIIKLEVETDIQLAQNSLRVVWQRMNYTVDSEVIHTPCKSHI